MLPPFGIAFIADGTSGIQVVNYLPFDNQGDSTQEYFADGITDAALLTRCFPDDADLDLKLRVST